MPAVQSVSEQAVEKRRPSFVLATVTLLASLLVIKTVIAVVWNYPDYLPPDFHSDFLYGRQGYFFGSYQWAFYAHIVSGPIALLLGLALVDERRMRRRPALHRRLGRLEGLLVLAVVAPSGLWMARYAEAGTVAGVGFAALAVATAGCAAMGWRTAIQRRFAQHRQWMWRMYLLLCSAVVIRVMGGVATIAGVEAAWFNRAIAWACWLVPLAAYEWWSRPNNRLATLATRSPPYRQP